MWLDIAYSIAAIVSLFPLIKIMDAFLEKRKTSLPIFILSSLPFPLSTMVFRFWFPVHPIAQLLIQLGLLFIITLNYNSFMIKRLAVVGSIFILSNVIDNFIGVFFLIFPNLITDYWTIVITILIFKIVTLFLTALLLRRFINMSKNAVDIPVIWFPTLIISGSGIFLGILHFAEVPHIEGVWVAIMWFAALFLIFYLSKTLSTVFEEKLKSALHAQEKEYYSAQCKLMQESVERVKSIRHDMKNHLGTLKDYTVENKAATDYLNSLLEDVGESEIYSDTSNVVFDSIINYKLKDAKKDNVKLDLKMFVPPIINVEVTDIATILGNLLDNALEAVAKVDEKIIKLDIEFGKGGLFIKIDNSFNGEIKYLEEKQIVSLKSGDEHGYGLKNITQSLEKYNGYMKITHTETIFSVGIFLYVDAT